MGWVRVGWGKRLASTIATTRNHGLLTLHRRMEMGPTSLFTAHETQSHQSWLAGIGRQAHSKRGPSFFRVDEALILIFLFPPPHLQWRQNGCRTQHPSASSAFSKCHLRSSKNGSRRERERVMRELGDALSFLPIQVNRSIKICYSKAFWKFCSSWVMSSPQKS